MACFKDRSVVTHWKIGKWGNLVVNGFSSLLIIINENEMSDQFPLLLDFKSSHYMDVDVDLIIRPMLKHQS